ncbi:hypothetical protein NST41_33920 [Paenibacillus sp. FSL L8-0696]|uniref:hypothetical protein n=1 Tax=Paenibacillus sp. FSL L8-0696 TaxID=2954524 RepID=UPI003119AD36
MQIKINFRKYLIIQLCLIILIVSMYPKKVSANPAVIGAAELGIGAYVLLILGAAAVGSELGYTTFSDDAKEHASSVWEKATQPIKDSLISSYRTAVTTGAVAMTLSADVYTWLRSNIMGEIYNTTTTETLPGGFLTSQKFTGKDNLDNQYAEFHYYPVSGYVMVVNGVVTDKLFITTSNGNSYASTYIPLIGTFKPPIIDIKATAIDALHIYNIYKTFTVKYLTLSNYNAILAKETLLKSTVTGTVAVPMPGDFVAHPKNDRTKTAVQNPDTGAWSLPDGTTIAEKDLSIDYPKPKVVDGVLTVPIGGVSVNAKTGEKVGDITGNPPATNWNDVPSDRINFGPLRMIGNLFTTKFPFSIPWDIERQFQVFNVTPKPAILKVDKTIPIFNTSMKLKFDIDFTIMEPAAVVVRWFAIIAFDLGMILSMRKFMPE